jgi:hypothetical protein
MTSDVAPALTMNKVLTCVIVFAKLADLFDTITENEIHNAIVFSLAS